MNLPKGKLVRILLYDSMVQPQLISDKANEQPTETGSQMRQVLCLHCISTQLIVIVRNKCISRENLYSLFAIRSQHNSLMDP